MTHFKFTHLIVINIIMGKLANFIGVKAILSLCLMFKFLFIDLLTLLLKNIFVSCQTLSK